MRLSVISNHCIAFKAWLKKVGIKPTQIYPGSPWENGYNERFN